MDPPPTILHGRRVTVMGLGRFGGGIGAVRFLAERGACVTLTDTADEAVLADSLAEIVDVPLAGRRLGGHDAADFTAADLIVASPAVPIDHPLLGIARAAGVPVTTEIGLFWQRCRGTIVGVTGSVGKSTTTAMIHAALTAAGRPTVVGGNLGGSLLDQVDRIGPDDFVVLELSSFQLEYLAPLRPRPTVAVVTNLRPNHLDRHGSLDAYRMAKQNLLRFQTPADTAVLNAADPDVISWPTAARVIGFGTAAPPLRVIGPHHRANAAAALAACAALGVPGDAATAAVSTFPGLPHRLEVVGEFAGRLVVNDSKATTPDAAAAALATFDRPIRLIAGGADKGVDLAPLADAVAACAASAELVGATGPLLAGLMSGRLAACDVHPRFDAAVAAAWDRSRPGDVILLSPGCASFGEFRDYRERGERFATLVRRAAGG